jgi:hypothetical protein
MRDTIAQRVNTMIPIGGLRKPSKPHVSHAETGAFIRAANPEAGSRNPTCSQSVFRTQSIPVCVKKARQNKNLAFRL